MTPSPNERTPGAGRSVREATFDVIREYRLTPLFANPGSTEVALLAGLPDDLPFVLGLHEASVVGMATGYALGTNEPALAILHTTPGLGNAVSALATARVNRAPLVVVVGQQDRRHLAAEPFLAGRLVGLAGDYPVWVDQPARAQDVPGAIARAHHEASTGRYRAAGGPDRGAGRDIERIGVCASPIRDSWSAAVPRLPIPPKRLQYDIHGGPSASLSQAHDTRRVHDRQDRRGPPRAPCARRRGPGRATTS